MLETKAHPATAADNLPSMPALRSLMSNYTTDHLVRTSPEDFERQILTRIGTIDSDIEGFKDAALQRDLSIKFHWGHNHDFGTFQVEGRMHDRHLKVLATFIDQLGALPLDLAGKRVLDIGCWTGGTCLLLAAMGAEVHAIEEVNKYTQTVRYLAESFGLSDKITVENRSLYDCTDPKLQDKFDFVLISGVVYHLTDPVLGLRICFNCLKDNGTCLIESAGMKSEESVVKYEGANAFTTGSQGDLNRGGWNWFIPSPLALERMILDAGFSEPDVQWGLGNRLVASAKRDQHRDILRAGLSVPGIR